MSKSSTYNGVYQRYYHGEVIFRLFNSDDKKMKEFHEDYKNHCKKRQATLLPPTKKDEKMADAWAKGLVVGEVAQKFGVSYAQADSAIRRVAKWRLRHEK